jgi:hypothetical protein
MNENRYAPPKAPVADYAAPPSEQSEIGRPALRFAMQLLWGTFTLGLLTTALEWKYLTSNTPPNQLIPLLSFVFALLAFLTYNVGRARNWARIVMLIFAIIGLPSVAGLPEVFKSAPVLASLSFVQTVIQLCALGILFFSSARHAFRRRE